MVFLEEALNCVDEVVTVAGPLIHLVAADQFLSPGTVLHHTPGHRFGAELPEFAKGLDFHEELPSKWANFLLRFGLRGRHNSLRLVSSLVQTIQAVRKVHLILSALQSPISCANHLIVLFVAVKRPVSCLLVNQGAACQGFNLDFKRNLGWLLNFRLVWLINLLLQIVEVVEIIDSLV